MLEEKEAFLRAIFDAPDDDTPRLVYADWLEEHGEVVPARAIRHSIEQFRTGGLPTQHTVYKNPDGEPETLSLEQLSQLYGIARWTINKFDLVDDVLGCVFVDLHELASFEDFRRIAVRRPFWFTATALRVSSGSDRITDEKPFDVIFSSPALRQVTELRLAGLEVPMTGTVTDETGSLTEMPVFDTKIVPLITLAGVENLSKHRGLNRIQHLDLRFNNLGNDALRFLARSPHLDNLKRLDIAEGNNFRGRVWQLLIERFGEDVVS